MTTIAWISNTLPYLFE